MEQNKQPSYDYAKRQFHNLENTEPITLEDCINRITENTQYLTENEYHNEFLVHQQQSSKETQGADYITSLLIPLLKQMRKNTSIDTFKK